MSLRREIFNSEAAAAATSTTIATWQPKQPGSILNLEIENASATIALSAFAVEIQDHPGGEFYTLVSTWSGLTFPPALLLSGAPATLAAEGKAHAMLFVGAANAVRFKATAASSTVLVKVRGSFGQY